MVATAHRPRRLDAGRILAALGAIALLVGLFLDWYSLEGRALDASLSAWTAFEIVDLLLALLALVAIAAALRGFVARPDLPEVPSGLLVPAGFAALLLVTVSIINFPPAASGGDPEAGIWISFVGAVAMALGALLRNAGIALVVTPREPATAAHHDPAAAPVRSETETEVLREP